MFAIQRCSVFRVPKSYQLSGIILGRRWIYQTSVLLNQEESPTDSDLTTKKPKKNRMNKLSDLVEVKTQGPPDSKIIRKLSPIQFMNQAKFNIPTNWRKDEALPDWKRQKYALNEKFKGKAWDPYRKLSREEMESVRMLKAELPEMTAKDISKTFKVSPEAIRRILKSKWTPTLEEEENIHDRWKTRGEKIKVLMSSKQGSEKKLRIIEKDGIQVPVVRNTAPKRMILDMGTLKDKTIRYKKNGSHRKPKKTKKLQDIMF